MNEFHRKDKCCAGKLPDGPVHGLGAAGMSWGELGKAEGAHAGSRDRAGLWRDVPGVPCVASVFRSSCFRLTWIMMVTREGFCWAYIPRRGALYLPFVFPLCLVFLGLEIVLWAQMESEVKEDERRISSQRDRRCVSCAVL